MRVNSGVNSAPKWNPVNPTKLAYVKSWSNGTADIRTYDLTGNQVVVVQETPGTPLISKFAENPISITDDNPSPHDIPSPDGNTYKSHTSEVTWSPDGTKFAFTSYEAMTTYSCNNTEATGGYANNASLFTVGQDCRGDSRIYTVNANGTGKTLIHRGVGNADPTWTPSGNIFFSSYGKQNSQAIAAPASAIRPAEYNVTRNFFSGSGHQSGCMRGTDGDTGPLGGTGGDTMLWFAQSQWGWNSRAAGVKMPHTVECPPNAEYLGADNTQAAAAHMWVTTPNGGGLYGSAAPSPVSGQGQSDLGNGNVVLGSYAQLFRMWSYSSQWFQNNENPTISPNGTQLAFTVNGTLSTASLNSSSEMGAIKTFTGLNASGGLSWGPSADTFYHTIRNADATGTWQSWTKIPGNAGADSFDGKLAAIAAMPDGSTQLLGQGLDGNIYHNVRYANNTWSGWGMMGGWAGAPSFSSSTMAITGLPGGHSQVIAKGLDGYLYHIARDPSGSWTPWGRLTLGSGFTDVALAGMPDSSTQVVGYDIDGQLRMIIRNSDGSWSGTQLVPNFSAGWAYQSAPHPRELAIAAMPNGSSQILVTSQNGTVHHKIRYGDETWSGLTTLTTGASEVAITGLPNGSSQVLIVGADNDVWHAARSHGGTWTALGKPAGINGSPSFKATKVGIAGIFNGKAQILATTG